MGTSHAGSRGENSFAHSSKLTMGFMNMVVHFLNHDSESEDYHDGLRSESDGGKDDEGPTSPLVLGLNKFTFMPVRLIILN